MARKLIFKDNGLTGQAPIGFRILGYDSNGELSEIVGTQSLSFNSWSKVSSISSDSTVNFNSRDEYGGKYIRITSTTGATVSIAPISEANWREDTEIIIEQTGVGQITVGSGVGVVINSSETKKTEKQYSVISLKLVSSTGAGTWTLMGERQLL